MNNVFVYFSDLHLEFIFNKPEKYEFVFEEIDRIKNENPNSAINVLAAGDISVSGKSYTNDFFDRLCSMVDEVFYCYGNHEYYGNSIMNTLFDFKRKFSDYYDNLHVMEDNIYETEDYVVISSTLWTNYDNNNPAAIFEAGRVMNDYKKIRIHKTESRKVRALDLIGVNRQSEQYIFNMIKAYKNTNRKVIVMTHHSPVNIYDYPLRGVDFAFCNEYENRISYEECPDYWIFGHVHNTYQGDIGDCRLLAHCIGYEHEYDNYTKTLPYFTI